MPPALYPYRVVSLLKWIAEEDPGYPLATNRVRRISSRTIDGSLEFIR